MGLIQKYKEKGFSSNLSDINEYCYKLYEIQKWLREVYNIKVTVLPSYRPGYNNYFVEILSIKKFKQLDGYYDIYEEALEEGLQVALELIK